MANLLVNVHYTVVREVEGGDGAFREALTHAVERSVGEFHGTLCILLPEARQST